MRLHNLIYTYHVTYLKTTLNFFFTLLNDIYITRMIMSNGTNWHLLNIVYTLIRVGREGGSYYLEQWMYVCMGGAGGRDPSFKIYNGDTSDDEKLFCWARRRRRRTRGGKTEDGKVRNRKRKRERFRQLEFSCC